jgi:hypothetical protein
MERERGLFKGGDFFTFPLVVDIFCIYTLTILFKGDIFFNVYGKFAYN